MEEKYAGYIKEKNDLNEQFVDNSRIEDDDEDLRAYTRLVLHERRQTMKGVESVHLRCEDNAETLVFNRYELGDGNFDFEINIEDSYCGGDYVDIKGRLKRAWKALFAKPICYTGVYIKSSERVGEFLENCMSLLRNAGQYVREDDDQVAI